jgi:hypothetical protein
MSLVERSSEQVNFLRFVEWGETFSSLGSSATIRSIVPVPDDDDDHGEFVECVAGETEMLEGNLPKCYSVHQKSHII